MLLNFICYLASYELGRLWWMVRRQRFWRMCLNGRQWTDPDRSLLDIAVQTCNPAHFFRRNAFTSETSDLSAQAVAYNVEILQFGTCLRHEELYQFRYVSSRWRCVQHSGYVVRFCGEQWPVDTDDVVIASSKIRWKEYSVWLQSLCTCYYILFSSGLTVWLVLNLWDLRLWLQWILRLKNSVFGYNVMWYGRQILTFRRVMLSTSHGRR